MFYTCIERFDVIENVVKFWNFGWALLVLRAGTRLEKKKKEIAGRIGSCRRRFFKFFNGGQVKWETEGVARGPRVGFVGAEEREHGRGRGRSP